MAIEINPSTPNNAVPQVNGISVIWLGNWNSSKIYRRNEGVFHPSTGSSYRANKTTTQTPSLTATDWDILAQASSTGDGSSSAIVKDIYFAYTDVSSRLIYTTEVNEIILTVTVVILVPFNGVGASISIGDSSIVNRLGNNTQIYLDQVGEYSINPTYKYISETAINLTLNAGTGATQGNGYIIIESK